MEDSEIKFIAKHYRRGAFSAGKAWKKLAIAPASWWTRARIAAAVAVFVVVSATATIIISRNAPAAETPSAQQLEKTDKTITAVHAIDFDNAPLAAVLAEVEKVYGIKIDGVPADAADMRLTLHYEGNAADLVDTINEILGTRLTIRQ